MRVLIIEDDASVSDALGLILKAVGYWTRSTPSGTIGLELASSGDFDLVLLDLNLPDMSGFAILRALRARNIAIPVLVLSGQNSILDKVKSLEVGADDFLSKPFHKDELVARVQAVVRRCRLQPHSTIHVRNLRIDIGSHSVSMGDSRLDLTPKEFELLLIFAQRAGSIVTKDSLLLFLYNGMQVAQDKILDVFLCKLRRKLASAANGDEYIETVRGEGYIMRTHQLDEPSMAA